MSVTTKLSTRIALAGAALALATAPACVTKGKYEDMVAERDALATERSALEGKVGNLEATAAQLDSQLSEQTVEIHAMKGTYDALVQDLQSELSSGQIQIEQLKEGLRVNVAQEILFGSGSASLSENGQEVLTKVSTELEKTPHRVEVLGHTDDVPISTRLQKTYPSNWELAGARAASVVRLFEENGLPGGRLFAVSRGEFEPRASNEEEDGRSKNRRIEIRLIPIDADVAAGPPL